MWRAFVTPFNTHIIFIIIGTVILLQIFHLILSPAPPSASSLLNEENTKIITHGRIMRSSHPTYQPILFKDLIDQRKDQSSSITALFITENDIQLSINFLLECNKFNLNNYVVFAMDNYTTCEKIGDHYCFFDESYDFSNDRKQLEYRINVTSYLVQQGYNLFVTSNDVILFDNPLLVCEKCFIPFF